MIRKAGGTVDGASPEVVTCYFEKDMPVWYMRGYEYVGVAADGSAIYNDYKYENGEQVVLRNLDFAERVRGVYLDRFFLYECCRMHQEIICYKHCVIIQLPYNRQRFQDFG